MWDKNIHQKINVTLPASQKRYDGQKYSPKNKYYFASFNSDWGLSLDDKTKDYVDRNT